VSAVIDAVATRRAVGQPLDRIDGHAKVTGAARFAADEPAFESPGHEAGTDAATDDRSAQDGLAILVAEDNDINALLTRHLLSRLGQRPVMAATGGDAVSAFVAAQSTGTPFDLVLMDLHMPGMDGIEAAHRIRCSKADKYQGKRLTTCFEDGTQCKACKAKFEEVHS